MNPVLAVIIAAAFSVALGFTLQRMPIPDWVRWAILAAFLFAAILWFRGL